MFLEVLQGCVFSQVVHFRYNLESNTRTALENDLVFAKLRLPDNFALLNQFVDTAGKGRFVMVAFDKASDGFREREQDCG